MSRNDAGRVRLEHVTLAYGKGRSQTTVFSELDLDVSGGESVALIGPSGCGKTSILHALCGLLKLQQGLVSVGGVPTHKPRRDVALILQDAGLLPWKTVWQNASLGLQLAGLPLDHVKPHLEELHIASLAGRYPFELSGGQRQRVGIARALATDPNVLLMDEPLANLDAFTKERIQDVFLTLWQRRQHTQVLVTHNLEEAVFLGQRIVVLSAPPARIVATLDNPRMGSSQWRNSDAFYAQVQALRKVLT